jgi:hypothetical protein
MALVFHRLTIRWWAIAFCAVVLISPSPLLPSVTAVLVIPEIASMMMVMTWFFGSSRSPIAMSAWTGRYARFAGLIVNVATARTHVRTSEPTPEALNAKAHDDALDLARMDDDGGWREFLMPS